ncbi:hypothetical protein PV04_03144 [Phialophora macrospora]|uniref:Zn(2)-C6 fungal-type domain-containing protein n=1 Tax=Phialophora macrospora TaxID=1851006 RepID=A0A0D2GFE4_9EURO|nr:hypothetical protein PV04_03144 [Phialophora macrospora]
MDRKHLQPLLPNSKSIRPNNPPPPDKLGRNKITRVGTACKSCKRRRSKCSGLPAPCKLCLQSGLECTFDPSLDGRRACHREYREAFMLQNRILTSLVQVIRFGSPSHREAVIECIRQDHSSGDIIDTIHESLQRPEEVRKGRGRRFAFPSESYQQELASRPDASDKDGGAGSPYMRRDNTDQDPPDRVIVVAECPQGNQDEVPTAQPADRIFCPTCSRRLLVQIDATTPPESVQDYQAATQVNDSCLQETSFRPAGRGPPAVTLGSLSRESDASDIQSHRHGWHFSLRPELQAPRQTEAALSVQTEREKANEQDKANLAVTQQLSQGTVSADIAPGLEMDGPGPSYDHMSRLYRFQTLIAQEETPLSRVIVGYRDGARSLISNGADLAGILGSDAIDVELFFRDRGPEDQFTVCNWACEVWRSFDDWDVFVRLAHILAYTVVMRWMLDSTAMSYAAIPDILKPRPIQYLVTHHIALDFLPLPPLRQALIKNLRDWMTALPSAKLKVNWTRGMDEAVVWDGQHQRRRLSQDFVKHVTNYQNWSIEESILTAFPEVKGLIRIDRVPNS